MPCAAAHRKRRVRARPARIALLLSSLGYSPLAPGLRGRGTAEVEFLEAALSLFTLAQSLGGVESLAAIPATMTHAAMSPQARREAGVGDGLIRLSVGLEAPEDLIADLTAAIGA